MYPPLFISRKEETMSHQEQLRTKSSAFTSAVNSLAEAIERLDENAATRTPGEGGWSAAQIAWHVGTTNELLGGVMSGSVPMAKPAPQGFSEDPTVFRGIPDRIQTFPQLEPPAGVTRADGLSKLRGSVSPYLAGLEGLSPERAETFCVPFSFGTLSMYQLADFASGHVMRHLEQVHRATSAAEA
jgi:hypothetical protein